MWPDPCHLRRPRPDGSRRDGRARALRGAPLERGDAARDPQRLRPAARARAQPLPRHGRHVGRLGRLRRHGPAGPDRRKSAGRRARRGRRRRRRPPRGDQLRRLPRAVQPLPRLPRRLRVADQLRQPDEGAGLRPRLQRPGRAEPGGARQPHRQPHRRPWLRRRRRRARLLRLRVGVPSRQPADGGGELRIRRRARPQPLAAAGPAHVHRPGRPPAGGRRAALHRLPLGRGHPVRAGRRRHGRRRRLPRPGPAALPGRRRQPGVPDGLRPGRALQRHAHPRTTAC